MNRTPNSRIDLCHHRKLTGGSRNNHNVHAETEVWARNYLEGEQWSPGVVTKQAGPVLYGVDVGGKVWNRQVNSCGQQQQLNHY